MEQSTSLPVAPTDPTGDRLFEFLRWHHTNDFAVNLLKNATTDPQRAYAIGYLCHVAASVVAEPFVNNVTGGPYRSHWWRNLLVSNFIDSWTFGFFESSATMTGDDPTPPYASWTPLCSANLQDQFNVAGLTDPQPDDVPDALKAMASGDLGTLPNQFPADLATLLEKTVNATFPPATQPIAGFSAAAFSQAFVGAFAVFWFMTSGSGPMCNNPIGAPPTTCLTPPSWITSGSSPSPQQAGLNVPGAVCAILLAILALLEFLTGNFPAGMAALIAAINAPIIDWATVRCELFWLRKSLVDAENALRDALVQGGLAYPPPAKLGTIDPNGKTLPATDSTPQNGVPFCRSNALSGAGTGNDTRYPHTMDTTNPQASVADLNFASYPNTPLEAPTTRNLIPANMYPNFVVNASGLQNGGVLIDGTYPSRYQFFGDAVSNAMQVIQNSGVSLPDYNLDADRGYGWKAWTPKSGTTPDTPPVVDVQE
jgi:hypothetical protein